MFASEEGRGITLGRHYDDGTKTAGEKISYLGERHLLLFGPTGTGKGTRFLIPNLLTITDRSIIVIDPKGELAAVTADFRRTVSDVVMLNPFNILNLGSAGFNPLATLDPSSSNFYDDAAALGEALIKLESKDPHWSESAQGLVVALIMWEKLQNGPNASLGHVRALLTEADRFQSFRDEDGKVFEQLVAGLRYTATKMVLEGGFEIESLAGRFMTPASNEISSIRSTGDTQTRWILSEPMRRDLMKPGIDFRKLKDRPTTVYVILPAERMRTHSTWLRLIVTSALRALYRPGGLRTLFMIDEMPTLGHLGPLEDAFGLVRGYNIQIAGICQDLSQLKALYHERWESFLANAGVVQGFAPNDLTTADWMSRRAGLTTRLAANQSENVQGATGHRSEGTSWTQVSRALYLPHELMGFTEGSGLFWLAGMSNGVRFFAPPYWKIDRCRERAAASPYYDEGSRVAGHADASS
jgi:type IV secretion system protein VirD4